MLDDTSLPLSPAFSEQANIHQTVLVLFNPATRREVWLTFDDEFPSFSLEQSVTHDD
jgi:hypothetical protein